MRRGFIKRFLHRIGSSACRTQFPIIRLMALGVSDGYDATSGEIQAGYLMQSTELECGHAFGRQMAWSYVSCPDVMARVFVFSFVESSSAGQHRPTTEEVGAVW